MAIVKLKPGARRTILRFVRLPQEELGIGKPGRCFDKLDDPLPRLRMEVPFPRPRTEGEDREAGGSRRERAVGGVVDKVTPAQHSTVMLLRMAGQQHQQS
jgi:hypothetical protein